MNKEEIPQANEERFAAAVRAVEGIIWTNSAEGKMVGIQEPWSMLTGQSYESYQGYGWADAVHPDDAQPTIDAWVDALANKKTFIFEHRVRLASGEYGIFSVRAIPIFDERGHIKEWVGVHTNITELRAYEETLLLNERKFKLLADSLPQKVWTADIYGDINYGNLALTLCFTKKTEIDNSAWLGLMTPDDSAKFDVVWKRAVAANMLLSFDHLLADAKGKYRWHHTQASPQKDDAGRISMWVGTSTDVHEQKMFVNGLEEEVLGRTKELNAKNAQLQKMNGELSSFTNIASHDLKEPLRKISIFTDRILEEEQRSLSPSAKDKFEKILKSVTRMQNLINDLLRFSESDKNADAFFEEVKLDDIILQVKEYFSEDIERYKISFTLPDECYIKCIRFQLLQVFQNLISNSIKFRKADEDLQIKIAVLPVLNDLQDKAEEVQESVQIIYSDNGIGFEQKYSDKIFEMFQRVHSREEYQGTGIGLAIVKKIIENHGGTITAKSGILQGVEFTMKMPGHLV